MEKMVCESCGAPLRGSVCEYCGTRYSGVDEEIETQPMIDGYAMAASFLNSLRVYDHERGMYVNPMERAVGKRPEPLGTVETR